MESEKSMESEKKSLEQGSIANQWEFVKCIKYIIKRIILSESEVEKNKRKEEKIKRKIKEKNEENKWKLVGEYMRNYNALPESYELNKELLRENRKISKNRYF